VVSLCQAYGAPTREHAKVPFDPHIWTVEKKPAPGPTAASSPSHRGRIPRAGVEAVDIRGGHVGAGTAGPPSPAQAPAARMGAAGAAGAGFLLNVAAKSLMSATETMIRNSSASCRSFAAIAGLPPSCERRTSASIWSRRSLSGA